MNNNFVGIILAGGFGTRLNGYGDNLPKGLIEHKGMSLAKQVIDDWKKSCGDLPLVLVSNNKFFNKFNETGLGVEVINNGVDTPDQRLGALGDLLKALEVKGWFDKDVLVMPSDTYYQFKIVDLINFFENHRDGLVTVFRKSNNPEAEIKNRLGCAVIEGDKVISFVEKPEYPPSPYAAVPFYIYAKEMLDKLVEYKDEGNTLDAPGSIIPWLLSKNIPVYGFITEGDTLDVGTISDVEQLQNLN